MVVRALSGADLEALRTLELEAFGRNSPGATLSAALAPPFTLALGAFSPGSGGAELVGYLLARLVAGDAEVHDVATAPRHRRKGVARALLEAGTEYLWRHGAERISLEVRVSNAAAIGLYRGFGFEARGRRVAYYADNQEDALILVLEREPDQGGQRGR